MGHFTNIFGNRETEKFGGSWVETYPKNYFLSVKQWPNAPTAYHLSAMWIKYFSMFKQQYAAILSEEVVELMCCTHACLPPPQCINALALAMLSIAQPQIVEKYPKFEKAYHQYMSEIFRLMDNDRFDELNAIYAKLNPGMQKKDPFSSHVKELWKNMKMR
jgi:hypothetical protein